MKERILTNTTYVKVSLIQLTMSNTVLSTLFGAHLFTHFNNAVYKTIHVYITPKVLLSQKIFKSVFMSQIALAHFCYPISLYLSNIKKILLQAHHKHLHDAFSQEMNPFKVLSPLTEKALQILINYLGLFYSVSPYYLAIFLPLAILKIQAR